MSLHPDQELPLRFAYLLIPEFSLMAFTASVEPLRQANRLSGRQLYDWRLFSVDGGIVTSGSGIGIMPHGPVGDDDRFHAIVVCAGNNPQRHLEPRAVAWLRRLARRGTTIGGLSTGCFLMAKAGLLDGYRCTIHWENLPGFLEAFPSLEVTTRLFEVDRGRFTCAGGTASLDLMLNLIAEQFGRELSSAVSEQFVHTYVRQAKDPQRMDLRQRVGVSHPKLLAAIRVIEANLCEPLSRAELARRVGLSTRQLERLFRVYLGRTPTRYYLEERLRHARQLLAQTSLSVLEVALACGFASSSHFTRSYRALYGYPPRAERLPPAPAQVSG